MHALMCVFMPLCVYVCVCVCTRARACVCMCMSVCSIYFRADREVKFPLLKILKLLPKILRYVINYTLNAKFYPPYLLVPQYCYLRINTVCVCGYY